MKSTLIVLLCLFSTVYLFNLDIRSAVIKKGNKGSYFGYTVALYNYSNDRNLIVGAPLADSNIPQSGAIYKCNLDRNAGCSQILIDRFGERQTSNGEKTESKSGQWLGASISTSSTGSLIICAPRYVHFSINLKRREPVGLCYFIHNLSQGELAKEISPCKSETEWGYHRLGSCQAGFSAAISKTGHYYYIGAPGSYYWQGKIYSFNTYPSKNNLSEEIFSTNDNGKENDDEYKGYSIINGRFSAKSDGTDIAVGIPKGNRNLSGKVSILDYKFNLIAELNGEVLGSYFGYSLAASDLDGDGNSDIVVSAPMFTSLGNISEYEQGRVYIFYQKKIGFFSNKITLDGFKSKSRFGQALTSLGDILKNGYDSIAIGAPYDGENGQGVVYIYNGGEKGVITTPSQIIQAEHFPETYFSTFGFSLASNVDMNSDEFPDLLIGAYNSDAVVFLKSRPVVNANVKFTVTPETISLENKECRKLSGSLVPCVLIKFCISYTGAKSVPNELRFFYNLTLDSNHKHSPRMFLLTREQDDLDHYEGILNVNKNASPTCNEFKAYILDVLRDKLKPIQINYDYDIFHPINYPVKENMPILNYYVSKTLVKNVTIKKNCGKDNVCIPDLQLSVTKNMDNYTIGTNERLKLNVVVHNAGEDAYESMLYVQIPEDINLVQIDQSKSDSKATWQEYKADNLNRIDFDLGNPLLSDRTVKFVMELSAKDSLTSSKSAYDFIFNLTTSNPELNTTLTDNHDSISIPLRVNLKLEPYGQSYINGEVKALIHNISTELGYMGSPKSIYPQVKHGYYLKNKGPSTIKEMNITILWPERAIDGNNLFELIAKPSIKISDPTNSLTAICDSFYLNVDLSPDNTISYHSDLSTNFTLTRAKRASEILNKGELTCDETTCRKIYCTVREMSENTGIAIEILSRAWNSTLRNIGEANFPVTSIMIAKVTKLQYNVDPSFLTPIVIKVTTDVNLIGYEILNPIPLWMIILAICFGLLILFLIILCLYNCGFFVRKRPPTGSLDTQPLHNKYHYTSKNNSSY